MSAPSSPKPQVRKRALLHTCQESGFIARTITAKKLWSWRRRMHVGMALLVELLTQQCKVSACLLQSVTWEDVSVESDEQDRGR